jgi:hypothetical protein
MVGAYQPTTIPFPANEFCTSMSTSGRYRSDFIVSVAQNNAGNVDDVDSHVIALIRNFLEAGGELPGLVKYGLDLAVVPFSRIVNLGR